MFTGAYVRRTFRPDKLGQDLFPVYKREFVKDDLVMVIHSVYSTYSARHQTRALNFGVYGAVLLAHAD